VRVLVIGGGGREHALIWRLSKDPAVERILCTPSNGGIAALATTVAVDAGDNAALADLAQREKIDLTIVGPEAPLVSGVVDEFRLRGLAIFGPTAAAARLEGSKAFAKEIMARAGVPTARSAVFTDHDSALAYVRSEGAPIVIKADGLAAGKGVYVAMSMGEAEAALAECFVDKRFGAAGDSVLVEEFLSGQEVSLLAFADGKTVLPMQPAQDYKRVFDGDAGPNTGGMGCYSPVPIVDEPLRQRIVAEIMEPVVRTMAEAGHPYQGVLYGGVILTEDGPKTLEFNCRFGDPETQVIMPRFEGSLADVMMATIEGRLADTTLEWSKDVCVTVVLASEGYPGPYPKGREISGLAAAEEIEGVVVFHAGTELADGKVLTTGGRVLNVSATAPDFASARDRAYEAIGRISFEGMHYRTDIAERAVKQAGGLA
jgi:phosphoribosylamine---glycine ligase